MKLIYEDESGDIIPITQGGSGFFALTAAMFNEEDRLNIELELRNIKKKYFENEDIEFKSNFIRYANPDLPKHGSPLKLFSRDKYNELEDDLRIFLEKIDVKLFSVVVNKKKFWEEYPSKDVYEYAYLQLMEILSQYLEEISSYGIIIIDPRDGNVEKQIIGDNLEKLHHQVRFERGAISQSTKIIERLLYSDSKNTIGIQIADLFCYPIFHIHEYNKNANDYWRYEMSKKKLIVLKLINTTKNDLEKI